MNLYPLRRCCLLIHRVTHLETGPDDLGVRAPRVPPRVSKLTCHLLLRRRYTGSKARNRRDVPLPELPGGV
jgi:hypothetical protein